MKQSLEKLHRGIVVPEVQQDPPDDPLTESLTEAWVLPLPVNTAPLTASHRWTHPGGEEGAARLESGHNQEWDMQGGRGGGLHYPQLSSPDWLEMATLAFSLNQSQL